MVPVLMNQLDDLRKGDLKAQAETKYLRERLRMFEGTSASGFKGFSGASNLLSPPQSQQSKQQTSPSSAANSDSLKVVAVNQDTMKKVSPSADPISNFLGIVNKLHFLVSHVPPTLKKDVR